MTQATIEELVERLDPQRVGQMKRDLLKDVLEAVAEASIRPMPQRTGQLRERTRWKVVKTGHWGVVKPGAWYAHFIHGGTQAHPILPKGHTLTRSGRRRRGARALRVDGGLYGAVEHPGISATHFFDIGLADSRGEVNEILAGTGEELFSRTAMRVRRKRKRGR